jgi:hypothetical protein
MSGQKTSSIGSGLSAVGAQFIAPTEIAPVEEIHNDKQSLARLLKAGVADVLARGQTINLEKNEELPRLIPVLCTYFTREELTELVGKKVAARLLEMHRLEVLQNLFLEGELQKVLHAFNEANIQIMLFKGPALAYTVYPQAQLRTYHDIDALIHPDDLEHAREVLTQMGYTFYEEYRANVINSKRTGYNFTLKCEDSWLEVLIELHTAPHESDIGTSFDVAALWANAQTITILGEPTLTMNPVDHLLYLCWHYRFHSFSRLLWLYDIVVLVRAHGGELDWAALMKKARQQHLATTLYYCLCWCRDLFGVAIPAQVSSGLKPPLACRLMVERVAMPDVVRTLVTAQGQSRRILAHRAMVDTTPGLLKAAARTLFPTPASMGQRYMEHSRLPLHLYFVYYLIHPWVTLGKGVRYVVSRHNKGND